MTVVAGAPASYEAGRKDEQDGHVHGLTLPDGTALTTTPPLPVGGEPVAEAPADHGQPAMGLRHQAKCPVPEPSVKPEDRLIRDRAMARLAVESHNLDALPTEGRVIWNRMRSSAIRFAGTGKAQESYAEELAWRAIKQEYHLGEFAEAPEAEDAKAEVLRDGLVPGGYGASKALIQGRARPEGAVFVIRTAWGPAERYGRVVTLALKGCPGASVKVGVGPAKRAILEVRVPAGLLPVGHQGERAAVTWVRENWRDIWVAAKAHHAKGIGAAVPQVAEAFLVSPRASSAPAAAPTPRRWIRQSKLFLRPDRATQRIAYGEAYVPYEVDLQGQYATSDEVARMAHGFLARHGKAGDMHGRWIMEDGKPAGEIVESFIARPGDPDFVSKAWVAGTKYHPDVWEEILAGHRKGFSIGGEWGLRPVRLAMVLN